MNINIWNSKNEKYAQLNQIGKCLAHEHKLRDFLKKVNLTLNKNIFLKFSANQWDRCREHGPAEELAQFLLELPSNCDDQKVSLKIEQTEGGVKKHRFDLNLLMYQLNAYKPDFIFNEVFLEGNFDMTTVRFAEGVDILFSKARRLYISNLKMKAISLHNVPKQTQL